MSCSSFSTFSYVSCQRGRFACRLRRRVPARLDGGPESCTCMRQQKSRHTAKFIPTAVRTGVSTSRHLTSLQDSSTTMSATKPHTSLNLGKKKTSLTLIGQLPLSLLCPHWLRKVGCPSSLNGDKLISRPETTARRIKQLDLSIETYNRTHDFFPNPFNPKQII